MRILFVLHQFYPEFAGGTEHVTLNLARMAQRAGHHVQVLAWAAKPAALAAAQPQPGVTGSVRTVYEGLPVLFLSGAALPSRAEIGFDAHELTVQELAGWMQEQAFDLAHVAHTMRMGAAVLALQRIGVPYLLTLTDFYLPCARVNLVTQGGRLCDGPAEGKRCARECSTAAWTPDGYQARFKQARALLAGAGERCVPSEFVAQRYRASFPDLDFRVLAHGIDLLRLGSLAPAPQRPADDSALRLVYVGSVIEPKGLDVVLRAVALLPAANLRLTCVGGFWGEGRYHEQVRTLAQSDGRVEFTGKLSPTEVFAKLRESDLLCLPSRVPESFSLVLHEAAAAGLPALVTELGAPAPFVTRHGCGRVVPAGDPQAWSVAIAAVLEQRGCLAQWRERLPLPLRVEEEAFFYDSLYRRLRARAGLT